MGHFLAKWPGLPHRKHTPDLFIHSPECTLPHLLHCETLTLTRLAEVFLLPKDPERPLEDCRFDRGGGGGAPDEIDRFLFTWSVVASLIPFSTMVAVCTIFVWQVMSRKAIPSLILGDKSSRNLSALVCLSRIRSGAYLDNFRNLAEYYSIDKFPYFKSWNSWAHCYRCA